MTDPRLPALIDTLLPGDGADWPAAGAHGLAPRVAELAAADSGGADALRTVLRALPDDFADLPQDTREARLRALETDAPETFTKVVTAAFNAYYTDSAIRYVIERLTGYENRPPQPGGYALEPFDETLLDAVKARGPIWRDAP